MEQGIVKYFVICESCGHVHRNTEIVICDACGANVSAKRITAKKQINPPKRFRHTKAFTIFIALLFTGIICVLMHTPLPMAVALLFVLVLISKNPVSPTLRFFVPMSLVIIFVFRVLLIVHNYSGSFSMLPILVIKVFFVKFALIILCVMWIYRVLRETDYMSRMDTNLNKFEDKTLSDDESSTGHDLARVKPYE